MKIILNRFSLLDFPGETSAIVYFYYCNLKCPYCYNLDCYFGNDTLQTVTDSQFFDFLDSRRGKLSAVVFSGGEPLLCDDNIDLIKRVKNRGFKTKIFTNGYSPTKLLSLVSYLDAIDLSIKTIPEKYVLIGGERTNIKESIRVVKTNFINYHFSCINFPYLSSDKETIQEIINLVGDFPIKTPKLTFSAPKLDVPTLMDVKYYSGLPWSIKYRIKLLKEIKGE